MANATREAELREVDALLAEPKALRGDPPVWEAVTGRKDLAASWIVEDQHGVARATLRFSCRRSATPFPTFALIFRNKLVWLVEIEDYDLAHRNPTWAKNLGLPATVRGSHEHNWSDNRDHLAAIHPDWEMPCRRPLTVQIRRLPQALAAFASAIHLRVESDQRSFDVPPQAEMFP